MVKLINFFIVLFKMNYKSFFFFGFFYYEFKLQKELVNTLHNSETNDILNNAEFHMVCHISTLQFQVSIPQC